MTFTLRDFHYTAAVQLCVHVRYSECAAVHIQRAVRLSWLVLKIMAVKIGGGGEEPKTERLKVSRFRAMGLTRRWLGQYQDYCTTGPTQ